MVRNYAPEYNGRKRARRPLLFFLQQEKVQDKKRMIKQIKRPDEVIVTEVSEIILTWTEFYAELYTAQTVDPRVQDFFLTN